jgi:hypothetical protein
LGAAGVVAGFGVALGATKVADLGGGLGNDVDGAATGVETGAAVAVALDAALAKDAPVNGAAAGVNRLV